MENLEKLPFTPFIIEADYKNANMKISNIGEFMINKGYTEKDFEREQSYTFRFNVDKIESYNDLFQATTRNGIYCAAYNNKYHAYREKIALIYERHDYLNNLTKFLVKPSVRMIVEYYINNKRKDLDNIEKPFIDALFLKAKTKNKKANDNIIYERTARKKFTYEEKEYIIIKFETLTKEEIERSSLLFEDNQSF